jgi:hypothetical protein
VGSRVPPSHHAGATWGFFTTPLLGNYRWVIFIFQIINYLITKHYHTELYCFVLFFRSYDLLLVSNIPGLSIFLLFSVAAYIYVAL